MNAARLAAKMRKMRENHEEAEMENGELNLVPYLDIVTNIIMFLMMTVSYSVALGNVNVSVPTVSAGGGQAADNPEPRRDLNLTVQISEKGFTIAASGGVLQNTATNPPSLPTIPKNRDNTYDYATLTKKMREIKDDPANEAQSETKAILNANPDITYEIVIATMDAIRGNSQKVLFPDVLLAAGVN